MPFDGLIPSRSLGAFPFGAARLRVHWASPLTKGMAGLWLLGRGGPPINLVTGEIAAALNTPTHAPGVAGPAWTNNGSSHGWEVKNGTLLSGRSEWTIAAVVAIPSGAASNGGGRAIYCERASSGNDITKLDFGPNNSTNAAVVWRNTAGNLINPSPSGDTRNSRQTVFAASMSWAPNTTTIRNYTNGALSWTDTVGASSVTQSNASKRSTIGYDFAATSSSNIIGDIALVAVFEPQWAAEQHALFARDPWDLLVEQAPIIIGRPTAGGATFNDTLSDIATATDALAVAATFASGLSDSATATDSLGAGLVLGAETIADTVMATDALAAAAIFDAVLSDTATATENLAEAATLAAAIGDSAAATDGFAAAATLADALSDSATATDAMAAAATFVATTSDTATASDSIAGDVASGPATYNDSIADTATATDGLAVTATFAAALAGSATASDSLSVAAAFTAAIGDTATATDGLAVAATAAGALSDTATAADAMAAAGLVVVVLADAATADDSMIGIVVGAGFSPSSLRTARVRAPSRRAAVAALARRVTVPAPSRLGR